MEPLWNACLYATFSKQNKLNNPFSFHLNILQGRNIQKQLDRSLKFKPSASWLFSFKLLLFIAVFRLQKLWRVILNKEGNKIIFVFCENRCSKSNKNLQKSFSSSIYTPLLIALSGTLPRRNAPCRLFWLELFFLTTELHGRSRAAFFYFRIK